MSRLLIASLLLLLAPRVVRAADNCTPSRAMIVLDKSSSMITGQIGGVPKWDIAVDALDTVATTYQSSIELGLMLFPNPDECSPGSLYVEPALGARDAIASALAQPPPLSGNWTPMAETLDAATNEPSLVDPSRARYVILISDGWQWCYPYDASTRFAPVTSVQNLKAMGVATYVVGFGDAVDALALNQMAVEAGTAVPGCDPTGDTPTAANPCYLRADSPAMLVASLDSIAVQISAETCDGVDNDCDGTVDETVRDCTAACGSGTETCSAGAWGSCSAAGGADVCDGIDNDCDGTVDQGCECTAGDTRACGDSVGACEPGSQTCASDGSWGDCAGPAVGPDPETCDGLDNDCDGEIDELSECSAPPVDGDASGCGCRTGGDSRGALGGLLLGLVGIVGLISRRRR